VKSKSLDRIIAMTLFAALAVSVRLTAQEQQGQARYNSRGAMCTNDLEMLYGFPQTLLLNSSVTATINPATGGFSSQSIGPVPVLASGGIVAVNAQFLYVSNSFINGLPQNGSQILAYGINQANGTLTEIVGSPFSFPPHASIQGLATAPNGSLLYAADANGSIDAFSVNSATGVIAAIPGSPFTSGKNFQLAVDPSGKFLYASDDDSPGRILAFTIDPSGALTPVPGSPFAIPSPSTVPNGEPYGIVDTGSFVYAALSAADKIAAFSIDSETGALTPVPGSPFSAGDGPTVLTLTNNFLYAVNWTDGNISGYSIDPSSGALTPVPGSPFGSDSATLTADPSGKYLYVSRLDGIQGYNINSTNGALTLGSAKLDNDGSFWMTTVQLPSAAGAHESFTVSRVESEN
jgi:6-phosphogluconolactonase (cycloisomerase 2 family)